MNKKEKALEEEVVSHNGSAGAFEGTERMREERDNDTDDRENDTDDKGIKKGKDEPKY